MNRRIARLVALVAVIMLSFYSATFAASDPTLYTLSMLQVNNSGVGGQTTLTDNGDGSTTVTIQLQFSSAKYDVLGASIRNGTPDFYSPQVAFPLNDVVNGASKTTIKISRKDLLSTDRVVLVQDKQSGGFVACGKIHSI